VLLVHGVQQFSDYQVIVPKRAIISDFFISLVILVSEGLEAG
jgi:hypothetical protein